MAWTRGIALAATLLLGAWGLTACGGGGGGGESGDPGSVDITGWWLVKGKPVGSSDPVEELALVPASQTNGTAWVQGIELARSGLDYSGSDPSTTDPERTEVALTAQSADLLTGTLTNYEMGAPALTIEVAFTPETAPVGTFVMTGTVESAPVDFSGAQAFARSELDGAEFYLTMIDVDAFRDSNELEITFDMPPPVTPGVKTVGGGVGQISVNVDLPDREDSAASGNVTFDVGTDSGRYVGTYDLTLNGGTITGSFDVILRVQQ